jgi:alpha-beta hydrolase superfamily lysophospholipase
MTRAPLAAIGTTVTAAGTLGLAALVARRLLVPGPPPADPADTDLLRYRDLDDVPGSEPQDPTATHVVHVHGQSLGPRQALRGVAVWRSLGASSEALDTTDLPLRSLDPQAVDRIVAAVDAARARGAAHVVLQGWSAGALACSVAAARIHVDGLVGVAPLLSIRSALRGAVRAARLPAVIGTVATRIATTRVLCRLAGVYTPVAVATWQDSDTPTLLLHSTADVLVSGDDVAAAADRGAVVETFRTARHTLEWNEDPARWEAAVRRFADRVVG